MNVALVLGGSGGIGRAAAKRLIGDGFQVCATYYKNTSRIEKVIAESTPNDISHYRCDVSNDIEVTNTIQDILLKYKKIDVVVFSVSATLNNCKILDLKWDDYKEHFEIQIKPLHYVIRSLREQIRARHKTKFILVLTEYCIGSPPKGLSHYVTAKYAAMGFSKAMAVELAQFQCTVNMISPGMVETALLDGLPSKLIEMTAYQNPLKRIATSNDVANVISFLASGQSDFLNGANIAVNGGGVLV